MDCAEVVRRPYVAKLFEFTPLKCRLPGRQYVTGGILPGMNSSERAPARSIRSMVPRITNGLIVRLIGSALLVGALTMVPLPAANDSATMLDIGAHPASAQGLVDVGILGPSFSELPRTVEPGETFTIGASTAPGARCSGQVTFRDHPPIDLEEVAAPNGTCSWSVTVPGTVRSSTSIIVIPITRSGQWWKLYGIVYVSPVGESR
jgi:hypothetical protein